MEFRRTILGKRGISHLLAVILIVIVTIALASGFYAMSMGLFSGVSRSYNVETTGSKIAVDVATGDALVLMNIKNIGTSPLRLDKISVFANYTVTVYFDGAAKRPQMNCSGVLSSPKAGAYYGSSPNVATTSDNVLNIPSGQVVSLEFHIDGATDGDMSKALELGATYNGILYQVTSGGPTVPVKFSVEG